MSLDGTKKSSRDKTVVAARYELYGSRQSYFTQKMQAAMEWYLKDEFDFKIKGAENTKILEARSGTHQIPVLVTPENWCIADSTPMLVLLDGRMAEPRFYPQGLVGSLTAVMEEYFDEWSARWCIHTRWGTTDETAQHAAMSMMLARNLPEKIARKQVQNVINWGRRASKALGVSSEIQKSECEHEIVRTFRSFEEHLKNGHGPFVFGDAPTAVDCVVMGGLRAHFLYDIYPKTLLQDLPEVHKWHDEFGTPIPNDVKIQRDQNINLRTLSPFVRLILSEMSKGFKTFIIGNRDAHENSRKSFVTNVYGEDVSYLYRPYPERSRHMLIHKLRTHLSTCTKQEVDNFKEIMLHYGLEELYLPNMDAVAGSKL
jgi:glutathione S-transferase